MPKTIARFGSVFRHIGVALRPKTVPAAVTPARLHLRVFLAALAMGLVSGCASHPPTHQENLCSVFRQHPEWYDYARESEKRWGTPIQIEMAFVHLESSYRSHAKPPYKWFLFIPLGRESSAKGYAQIQDPAWEDYKDERGGWFKGRSDMEDVLDFIGWYNDKSSRMLGISKWDPKRLYLAYHEGRGGYRRGTYKHKPQLLRVANRVDRTAREYGAQLKRCEDEFKCRKWYQIGLFCH